MNQSCCAFCGAPIPYKGKGPRKRFCADACQIHALVRRELPDECWPWMGPRSTDGYGLLSGKFGRAHRLAYALFVGDPAGADVLHTCDNRPCCNPRHLYLGTNEQNVRDRVERNRTAKGSRNARAKLTEAQVALIRQALVTGRSPAEIGLEFGVHAITIRRIRTGSHWRAEEDGA